MKKTWLALAALALAALAFAAWTLTRPSGGETPPEHAKPAAPFTVTLVQTSENGDYRTLDIHVSTQVDLSGASLALVPFDGLTVVEPASPLSVDLRAGDNAKYRVRVRLSPTGGGTLTAELTARFPDGSSRVASDVVRYAGGEPLDARMKIQAPRPGPIRVQEVPAAPGGEK